MPRLRCLASSLVLTAAALTCPAGGQEPPAATLEQRRGLQVIRASGQLPAGTQGALEARLRLGDRVALQTPLLPGPEGRVEVSLVTARRLLPDRYQVEVGPPGEAALLSWGLTTGDEQAVREGQALERAWLAGAAGALRGLTVALERRGRFHAALALAADADKALELKRVREFLQGDVLSPGWYDGLRVARMDLGTFASRLLFTREPAALAALQALVPVLEAQAGAWEASFDRIESGVEPALPEEAPILAAVRPLLEALGRGPDRLRYWQAGDLAEPPAVIEAPLPPAVESPLGFRLEVPASYEPVEPAQQRRAPNERLRLRGPEGRTVVVTVQEFPDAIGAEGLIEAQQTANWEGLLSYKLQESEPLPEGRGLRLSFVCNGAVIDAREVLVTVEQLALFQPDRQRVVSLTLVRPRGQPLPEEWPALMQGFSLTEGGR